jgi:hypothetical protein
MTDRDQMEKRHELEESLISIREIIIGVAISRFGGK